MKFKMCESSIILVGFCWNIFFYNVISLGLQITTRIVLLFLVFGKTDPDNCTLLYYYNNIIIHYCTNDFFILYNSLY